MSEAIKFSSDIRVKPSTNSCGSDEDIALAAWAIPPRDHDAWNWEKDVREGFGKDVSALGLSKVISACMRLRHNSPFEHGLMSVYAEMPGVVWWQLTRQRFMSLDTEDFAFNLESGRYKALDDEFYIPPEGRPILESTGFNPMRPELRPDESASLLLARNLRHDFTRAWASYSSMLANGIAREVARLVLPNWALYCDGYVTAKPLTWLQFFSKRRRGEQTAVATFPQWEIEQFAARCEDLFAAQWPITHSAFLANGRQAP